MKLEVTDRGSVFTQGSADGEQGSTLSIQRKWNALPEHMYGYGFESPQYRVAVRGYHNGVRTITVDLSDRQMLELFHAWGVLRQEYVELNPKLAERDEREAERKQRQKEV